MVVRTVWKFVSKPILWNGLGPLGAAGWTRPIGRKTFGRRKRTEKKISVIMATYTCSTDDQRMARQGFGGANWKWRSGVHAFIRMQTQVRFWENLANTCTGRMQQKSKSWSVDSDKEKSRADNRGECTSRERIDAESVTGCTRADAWSPISEGLCTVYFCLFIYFVRKILFILPVPPQWGE